MEAYEEIRDSSPVDATRIWAEMCTDCMAVQDRLLADIVRHAVNSDYGRAHGFGDIRSLDDFRRSVPVSDYEDIEAMVEHIADTGAEDVLFEGPTVFFTSTSGTTGRNKKIPESIRGQDAKAAVVRLRSIYLNRAFAQAAASSDRLPRMLAEKEIDPRKAGTDLANAFHFFPIASATPNKRTPGGIEVGFASGRTFDTSTSSEGLAYPRMLMGIRSNEAAMYLTMLFATMHDDVVTIAGNNASRMYARIVYAQDHAEQLIRDMRNGMIDPSVDLDPDERTALEAEMRPNPARADRLQEILDRGRDEFVPRNYWPYLLSAGFWLSGSVGANVDRIRPMLGDITYFDVGYGASEAKINVPMESGVGYGPLAIASAFFEFIPVGSDEVLTADRLEDGGEYEIILTTYSGLYRYNIHDIVKVRGFTGNTPNVEFVTKSREILNVSQEKVPAPVLVSEICGYMASQGVSVRQGQVWPDNAGQCYHIFLEAEGDPGDAAIGSAATGIDGFIGNAFQMYGRNRELGALAPARVFVMKHGWQDHLYRTREAEGAPRSQIKLDSLAKSRPDEDWIEKEVSI